MHGPPYSIIVIIPVFNQIMNASHSLTPPRCRCSPSHPRASRKLFILPEDAGCAVLGAINRTCRTTQQKNRRCGRHYDCLKLVKHIYS